METTWKNEASFPLSSSSSSISRQFKYDLFLSFSGVDTRNNFTSHLLDALERHGFHTFRDDTKLNRGEYIGDALLKAIEESRISLVVLSKNYAASRWCLDELVKIMDCRKTLQQIVLPIFYNVEPSDVRVLKGSLAEAFAEHEKLLTDCSNGRVKKWKEALTKVANLSGWDVANGDEARVIRQTVEEVRNKLDPVHLHVACHEIGLESRLKKLKMLLKIESADVRIVAVWGMGGIGKTTVVKKLYNLIQHKFEGSCFLVEHKMLGWVICIFLTGPVEYIEYYISSDKVICKKVEKYFLRGSIVSTCQDQVWFRFIPQGYSGLHLEGGDEVEISIKSKPASMVKYLGVDLIYKQGWSRGGASSDSCPCKKI